MVKIYYAMGNKEKCYLVVRDVQKAFDRIWHNGLRFKIIGIGINELILKSLSFFLNQRTASNTLETHIRDSFNLLSGGPQGNTLSPTTYTIYTHDIPVHTANSTNILYADDITQIITQKTKKKKMISRITQREIRLINDYEKKWKIQTNIQKYIFFYQ